LTPASLAELMGGPNIEPPPQGRNMAGPPNAYNENNPLPPPWYPQPLPSPTPAPPPPAGLPLGAAEAPAPAGPGQ
jgi:phospholipid/cholesterol/gamma-HCH transport system substrate-binding protein